MNKADATHVNGLKKKRHSTGRFDKTNFSRFWMNIGQPMDLLTALFQ
jgi:hypothetical protein